MEEQKKKNSFWHFAALALLLCVSLFAISFAPAFARYMETITGDTEFEVREPEYICIGTVDGENNFTKFEETDKLLWDTESEEGVAKLSLTVANGVSSDDCSSYDQSIKIRIVGGADLSDVKMKLILPETDSDGKNIEITAAAEIIPEDTGLYYSYGPGYVFTFAGEAGEYSRILEGGKLSYVTFTVVVDTENFSEGKLIQPHIFAEIVD